jgi:hypothetical protein
MLLYSCTGVLPINPDRAEITVPSWWLTGAIIHGHIFLIHSGLCSGGSHPYFWVLSFSFTIYLWHPHYQMACHLCLLWTNRITVFHSLMWKVLKGSEQTGQDLTAVLGSLDPPPSIPREKLTAEFVCFGMVLSGIQLLSASCCAKGWPSSFY